MSIYSHIFCVLLACLTYIVYQRYGNVNISLVLKPEKRYDYIIVGAGTSGCVLAARLSEDPNTSVLLLEAGDHMGYFTRIPLTPTAAQLGPNDWSVRTTRQRYSSFGLWDQVQILPRGKGLGGSSQINFLLHGLGLPRDYEAWSRLGFHWSRSSLRPYFLKAFGSDNSEFDSTYCSLDGYCPGKKAPIKLKRIDETNELMQVFKRASSLTRDKHTIFRKATATVKDGVRQVALDGYLKLALKRKNLHVLLNTQGVTIRFANKRASSIFTLQNHRVLNNIFANKEIILCAGAIKTPQILITSGVGPKEQVQRCRLKLQLIAENSQVGKNLHDHVNVPIYVSIKKPISVTLAKVFGFGTAWDYFWKGEGLLAFPPVAGVEFQNTSGLMLFSMGTASERLLRDLSNYDPQVFRDTFPFHNDTRKEGFMFLATCLQPRSRGSVTLRDISTAVPPLVNPNYLHRSWDVRCVSKALRRAEQLVSTQPFKDIGARIHWPRPERCLHFWNYSRTDQTGIAPRRRKRQNQPYLNKAPKNPRPKELPAKLKSPPDEYLHCIIREIAVTGHHVAGTCAGGTVVDDQLRVKSVSGLRIVDASILPSPLSLYPNSVLIAMAERAADLINNKSVF